MKKMNQLFALVDANSFYASCERIFNPKLKGKALVVLSNNDGCAVARTQEAKDLGVKMGEPYFKIRSEFGEKVVCKSSNYMLYGEISRRFHVLLSGYASGQEVYSIDESFLDFTYIQNIEETSQKIYNSCLNNIGLPVCVGVGSTKTRAKFANFLAKKNKKFQGICNLENINEEELQKLMRIYDVGEVWGIGRQNKDRLNALGIYSIFDLYNSNPKTLCSLFSVVMEKTVEELRGISCLELEEVQEKKKQIMTSRSFASHIESIRELGEAISYFCMRGGEKLRKQESRAGSITVFVQTNRFRQDHEQYNRSHTLGFPIPTDDSQILLQYALRALNTIYKPGIQYKKAGVLLSNLESGEFEQINLFGEQSSPTRKKLMEALDSINGKYGKDTLCFGSQGDGTSWAMRSDNKSPDYLHDWKAVPVCY